jgi:transcriptional regulator with XRE-family HTH domain
MRLARGISQEQLGNISGLDRIYISGLERGQRNVGIDNVEKIAYAMKVPATDLLK